MFQNVGFTEILLIAVVALVLFGPQKLPEIGRMLGKTMRDFKQAANELMNDTPKASNTAMEKSPKVIPDPIVVDNYDQTPVVQAAVVSSEPSVSEPIAPVVVANLAKSADTSLEQKAEQEGRSATKPAVAFKTNKSPMVVEVAGSPIEAEEVSSSVAPSTSPTGTQQAGSTSPSRRLPD